MPIAASRLRSEVTGGKQGFGKRVRKCELLRLRRNDVRHDLGAFV